MAYLSAAILAFTLSAALTPLVIFFAKKFKVIDQPGDPRKIHQMAIPLMGGTAIFLSFFLILGLFLLSGEVTYQALHQSKGVVLPKNLVGIFIGSLIIMIWGIIDDRFNLKPRWQIVGPVLAVLAVIIGGIGITAITNPLGGLLRFDNLKSEIAISSWPFKILWLADLFTVFWLLTMMYTTKLLDGLDGLVTGITALGALFIFFLSLKINQPFTALMAIILAGANLGFLIFNFHPARIFLGEGGSLWAGFMIGSLAIVSGSKVATTMLIMGIPFLDVIWVIIRRVFKERQSLAMPDRKHLHHRLLDIGLNQRKSVLLFYFITAAFGVAALFLQSFGKLLALGALLLTMLFLGSTLVWLAKRKNYERGQS